MRVKVMSPIVRKTRVDDGRCWVTLGNSTRFELSKAQTSLQNKLEEKDEVMEGEQYEFEGYWYIQVFVYRRRGKHFNWQATLSIPTHKWCSVLG